MTHKMQFSSRDVLLNLCIDIDSNPNSINFKNVSTGRNFYLPTSLRTIVHIIHLVFLVSLF